MNEFKNVIDIYKDMENNELIESINKIKNELDDLFRERGDQDYYQGLMLHYTSAKKEARNRDLYKS